MTDYLIAMCDSCGHHVRVSLEHGGRRAKCPKCAAIIEIPRTESGILRLRTDTELTREARAKAGRGDPDSDPTVPAADRTRPSRSSGGKHTTVHRKVVHPKKKGGPILLVISLIATVGIMVAIGVILLKKPPGTTEATAPPPPPAPPSKAIPAPPKPPPVENEAERDEIVSRLGAYIRAFNTNDIDNKIAEYHDCDAAVLKKAFGKLGGDFLVTYEPKEKLEVAKFEWSGKNEARVTFKCVRAFTENNTTDRKDIEKTLTWVKKDGKWKIAGQPDP